jgi:hypothetical protein
MARDPEFCSAVTLREFSRTTRSRGTLSRECSSRAARIRGCIRNRIHDGLGTGVQIEDGGEALLEENDIAGHVLAEVAICRGANPILRRNRIHDSHRSGVLVYENGLGLIEMNDFFGNAWLA